MTMPEEGFDPGPDAEDDVPWDSDRDLPEWSDNEPTGDSP